jgi:hypothetical protein
LSKSHKNGHLIVVIVVVVVVVVVVDVGGGQVFVGIRGAGLLLAQSERKNVTIHLGNRNYV